MNLRFHDVQGFSISHSLCAVNISPSGAILLLRVLVLFSPSPPHRASFYLNQVRYLICLFSGRGRIRYLHDRRLSIFPVV